MLIIDDSRAIRMALQSYLEQNGVPPGETELPADLAALEGIMLPPIP